MSDKIPKTLSLTVERLKEVLHYDPLTGVFTWIDPNPKLRGRLRDNVAGSVNKEGYRYIKIDRVLHRASRLAWLYMTGEHPVNTVDHRNLQTGDDRWDNLREATQAQQIANQGLRKCNTSGYKGIVRQGNRWVAKIGVGLPLPRYLGIFVTKEEAYAAYTKAAVEEHGEFVRLEP